MYIAFITYYTNRVMRTCTYSCYVYSKSRGLTFIYNVLPAVLHFKYYNLAVVHCTCKLHNTRIHCNTNIPGNTNINIHVRSILFLFV